MPALTDALSADKNGTLIAIEVSANAKSARFPDGYNPWRNAIGCRVTAPATDGKANRAVIALISEVLSVSPSSVTLAAGQTSTQKKVLVSGLTPGEVAGRLAKRS
jgi:uncharacterized protein